MIHQWIRFTLLGLIVAISMMGCGGDSPPPSSLSGQASLADTPEIKAAMEFASAQAFEKSHKTKQAIDIYKHIVTVYAESPQAKLATDRMKALGGK